MSLDKIIVPSMGESINEVLLIKLYKKEGDFIKKGETIADLATDKVDTELVSNFEGYLQKIFFTKPKEVIAVGETFAIVSNKRDEVGTQSNEINTDLSSEKKTKETVEFKAPLEKTIETFNPETIKHTSHLQNIEHRQEVNIKIEDPQLKISENEKHQQSKIVSSHRQENQNNFFLSPVVTQLLLQYHISVDEISYIQGTGIDNRITKKDILHYIESKNQNFSQDNQKLNTSTNVPFQNQTNNKASQTDTIVEVKPDVVSDNFKQNVSIATSNVGYIGKIEQKKSPTLVSPHSLNEEEISLDRIRQTISKNLTQSKNTNVHVTSFAEVDMSNVVYWREKNKHKFEQSTGQKLTYTPIFVSALINSLIKYPILNGVLKNDETLLLRKDINIGIATALPDGNLIVPIIKQSQNLNLVQLSEQINTLAHKARNKQLNINEIANGTFTLTNIGTFNSLMGTPILPTNQSGILATGVIQKKPMVKQSELGEVVVIRHMMYVSLSYDHRIIDGIVGGGFLNYFSQHIENFDVHQSF